MSSGIGKESRVPAAHPHPKIPKVSPPPPCGVQREERIVHAFGWFCNWLHQNNAPCSIVSLFNKNTDVNVNSITVAKKLNLLLKHRNCGHVTGRSCVEYSVWGQSRGVVWGQLNYYSWHLATKVIFNCIIQPINSWIKISRKITFIGLTVQ